MYRFLRTPRWIAGHVLLVVVVVTFVNLGFWQLRRLDERRELNARIAARADAALVPLADALARHGSDPSDLEYRRVVVDGRFAEQQVLTAPRSRDGRPGPQVLAVLDRGSGPDLLVDRGWIPFARDQRPPAPPDGDVTLVGLLRAAEPGDIGGGQQVRAVVPAAIGDRLDRRLAPVWLQLLEQDPAPAAGVPLPASVPELGEGSHLSYAVQWFTFAVIALIGYPLLVVHTARGRDQPTSDRGGGAAPATRGPPARLPSG